MRWKDKLINDFSLSIEKGDNIEILDVLELIKNQQKSVHLAIFSEPFLSLMLSGQKTMESRFSINNVIPYRKVLEGDIVFIKKSPGSVIGLFVVGRVEYVSNLTSEKVKLLEKKYGRLLCWNVDADFLENKSTAKFVTLIDIKKIFMIDPIEIAKVDRTAWSIVKLGLQNTLFEDGKK